MRAFLFDLDDTLFDHRHATRIALDAIRSRLPPLSSLALDLLEEQHAQVLEEFHQRVLAGEMDVDRARLERFRRLVSQQRGTIDDEVLAAGAQAYRRAYVEARRAVAGAVDVLEALRPYGRIAVISNNVEAEQVAKMAACGIDRHIDALVVSEAVGVTKPNPAIFLIALERLGARANEAIMIGDSWSADIEGARAAGIRAIWYNPLARPCPDPAALAAEIAAWEPAADAVRRILNCTGG